MIGRYDVLIVGGGHAGAQAASALRQNGFGGTVALVGDEVDLPYDRPPLSKEYLASEKPFEKLGFRSSEQWLELGIDMLLGRRVVRLDPLARIAHTGRDDELAYGTLIWAAGGAPRSLACDGGQLAGVHSIRNRADVDRLKAELPQVARAVVIGGGYIGLEAAAVLRKLGKEVTLIETQDRVLARVAAEPLSSFYEAEHRGRGVDLRLGTSVDAIEGCAGRVHGVRLAGGVRLAADIVIVGIGIVPEIAALADSGAEVGNGVRIDPQCRTSLPNVFAIGDCAEHRNRFANGQWVRLESVQNANDQAVTAARTICGLDAAYSAVPWFWSNQYDLRLQTVGLSAGHDDLVLRGEPRSRSFSIIYLRGGRVVALDCVNAARDYTHGRLLVTSSAQIKPSALADTSVPLKTWLPCAGQ